MAASHIRAAWRCPEQYEPEARPHDTHMCILAAEHEGWHQCPLCGSQWDKPGGAVRRESTPVDVEAAQS